MLTYRKIMMTAAHSRLPSRGLPWEITILSDPGVGAVIFSDINQNVYIPNNFVYIILQ